MSVKDRIERIYYKLKEVSIRRFWENIERWLSYYKVARRIYDFDYTSILEVERHQIKRVRASISKYHNHVNAGRDIERLNLALRLLDIISENGCSDYSGKGLVPIKGKEGMYEMDPESFWTIPVYVNTRNSGRFQSINPALYADPKSGPMHKDSLRVEKAWHIYHRLRVQYMRSWWD